MLKKILLALIIGLFVLLSAELTTAQNNVILLQGKVINKEGKPVGANVHFINAAGKKTSSKSNIADGSYQLVLPSGEKYVILIDKHILEQTEAEYFIPPFNKYAELNKDFNPKEIVEGMKVFEFRIFEAQSDRITEEAELYLLELKEFMTINKNMLIELTLLAKDSHFQDKTVKETVMSGKRKKTVSKKITHREQTEELLSKREEALKARLAEMKVRDKNISLKKDYAMAPPPPKPVKSKRKNAPPPVQHWTPYTANVSVKVDKIIKM